MRHALLIGMALMLASSGCAAGEDRPPVTDEGWTTTPLLTDLPSRAPAAEPCDAGSVRSCVLEYVDLHGDKLCPRSVQYCELDGHSWGPCGGPPPSTKRE